VANVENLEVAKVEENAKIILNNIFFDFDKSVLKPESFPELNRLVSMMNERPTMQVEIAGHTDKIGTEEYNMGLSERRARAVAKHLTDKGISSKRVSVVFFGETKLIDPNGNAKNRRVEFKITKM
jgi:outer membrane protein OmpA-like peptidoglycan-associated protein